MAEENEKAAQEAPAQSGTGITLNGRPLESFSIEQIAAYIMQAHARIQSLEAENLKLWTCLGYEAPKKATE